MFLPFLPIMLMNNAEQERINTQENNNSVNKKPKYDFGVGDSLWSGLFPKIKRND